MATYPGMSLRGEVRESISLDEDDLSDVEDEVFIRDGKNGYKLAEELNVKRPLMAPRRKLGRQDIGTRMKNKPPCRAFCKPCCYVSAALGILIGLIILVVILVSMYPLPLDRFRDWVIKRSHTDDENKLKFLPCNNLRVTEVWSTMLPKLTTDSPVRTLDVNGDGIEDVVFGFGTGENSNVLSSDIFCPIFMGVPPPCDGGIAALNGLTGDIIWRRWFNDTMFSLHCTADINGDLQNDCLATGMEGTIVVLDSKNGSIIWQLNTGRVNVFVANFVPDLNNDSVQDVLASHSTLTTEGDGHIVLFSGKNGQEIKRIAMRDNAKIFYMPQLLVQNSSSTYVLFGTGSPSSSGNLSVTPLSDIASGVFSNSTKTLYTDKSKGVLTQSVIVDITGDNIPDIVTAMYNSTVVAINGKTFQQIWNFTVPGPNSETNITPTPGYFNSDNVTDFLIVYQKYDNILDNNYTQAFIIDGKTGESIYNPFGGSMITQMGGLSISADIHGYDIYLFWTAECTNVEMFKKTNVPKEKLGDFYDECRRQFNTTRILRLNALNQFHQPPGFTIYNSADHVSQEFSEVKSPIKLLKEFYRSRPKEQIEPPGQTEVDENYNVNAPIGIRKYGASNFRHKDGRTGIVKNYGVPPEINNPVADDQDSAISNQDYDWQNQPSNILNDLDVLEPEFNNYPIDDSIPYNRKHLLMEENLDKTSSRDPRSKDKKYDSTDAPTSNLVNDEKIISSTKKKNLSDKHYGIYDYRNVRLARNRLLHDINNVPTEILKDTFLKNEERRLRKSKFEQRDINAHNDKLRDNDEVQGVIEDEKLALQNNSLSLWDLESEKEVQDWESGSYRGKREVNYTFDSITKITSVGALLNPFSNSSNSIDVIFITYWQPAPMDQDTILKQDIHDCIEEKLLQKNEDQTSNFQKTADKDQRALLKRECLTEQTNLKKEFAYFNQLFQLRLGQMSIYRLRIECECTSANKNEKCVKFLPKKDQSWSSYLGRNGDGVFVVRN